MKRRGRAPRSALAWLCLTAALAASAQTGAVQGRVVSSLHGEPIADVMVTLRELKLSGESPAQIYVCQTGADGRFSIAGMVPGIYDPRPSKDGFEARPPDRFATAHDFPPVAVGADQPVTGVELRLIPDVVIAGKVLDADGDPVRYADVEAQRYQYAAGKRQLVSTRRAETNDRGEYRMFYLPPGRYYMHATSTDRSFPGNRRTALASMSLAAAFYPGVADPARATELQVQPGGELDGIDIRLAPEKRYSIRGRVPAGDGGHGIRVVERSSTYRPPQYSFSFTRDTYEIRNIAPGSYLVMGDSFNPAHPEERQYARQPVDVIDRDVDGVDLTYSPGVQVKGKVKLEGAAPLDLGKLQLFLQADDFTGRQGAKIAADGTFTSPELAPGSYQLDLGGRDAYVKSVRLGDRELPDKKVDVPHPSGDLTVLISADFGQVEGTVTDETGKPVYNVDVTLIPDQSASDWQQRFRSAFTLTDGKFSFKNVQPGEYKAFAWLAVEPGAPQSADFRKPYEDRAVAVRVEANKRNTADLKAIVIAPDR